MKYQFKGRRYNFHQPVAEELSLALILSDFVGLVVLLAILVWVAGQFYQPL